MSEERDYLVNSILVAKDMLAEARESVMYRERVLEKLEDKLCAYDAAHNEEAEG